LTRAVILACALAGLAGATARAQSATASDLRAAFLLNFARFTDWPALAADSVFMVCVMGDDPVAAAVHKGLGGDAIHGRQFQIETVNASAPLGACHLLFIGAGAAIDNAAIVAATRGRQVLTVSSRKGFAQSAGIIELFVESGRMRFAINVDEVQRSGLTLSSRLLTLAKVVHDKP
jgi:hypothetical protein